MPRTLHVLTTARYGVDKRDRSAYVEKCSACISDFPLHLSNALGGPGAFAGARGASRDTERMSTRS